jgi:hypothetical protein
MGYSVEVPSSPEDALQRLRFNPYRLVWLAEPFGQHASTAIASYLANLNMHVRRDIFVVLMGERFKTGDHWQAFVESVDLVYNPVDFACARAVIQHGLSEHARLYRVFRESLATTGKRI